MRPNALKLTARYFFPVDGPPVAGGVLTIEGGKITRLEPRGAHQADLDLGNVAVTPGFINAHTHLELSAIPAAEGPKPGPENEISWLRRVIDQRRGASEGALVTAVGRNLKASVDAGTTMLADTTTAGLSWDQIAEAPVRAVVFTETIGLKRSRALQTNDDAWAWLATISPEAQVAACARPGISPHAPYSTSGWLYHRAASSRMPLSTHLAEMPEELEFLEHGTGPLREFLEDIGAWDDEWEAIGPRPSDYIRKGELRKADWLIAHGTYIDPDDFWQLRPEAGPDAHRVAVAYCPRTHARFGHRPHPFREMLARGVIVALGTDSLASNPSLSILDEVRFLHRRDPSLGGPLLLTMATLFGAWALRAETITGSLTPSKSADLAVIPLPDRDAADPHELLLESDFPVIASMFEGNFVRGPW